MKIENTLKIFLAACLLLAAADFNRAQVATGGGYTLEQSIIAAGGGTSADATNNSYRLVSTVGEAVAGTISTGGGFSLKGGFLNAAPTAPTAAAVSIGGRVRTASGKGIRNVIITLTLADGTSRAVLSGISGRFNFPDVAAGQFVVLSASAKKFNFSEPTQVLNVTEDFSGIEFVALEQATIK